MSEQTATVTRGRGLTWRSLLALLYITFVFQSSMAFMHLVTGSTPAYSAVQWATILLFIELAAVFAGTKLTIFEAVIIYLAAGQTIKYWWFLTPTTGNLAHPGWIYQAYLRYSPVSVALGLADKIPWFYAPESYEVWLQRTLFHQEWTIVALWTAVYLIAAMFGDFAMSILGYHLYVRIEKLPFPYADPIVDTTRTLIEREWRRMSVLGASSILGFFYGLLLYTLPLTGEVFLNVNLRTIPIPWADYNYLIQQVLPGASFGVATDLAVMATGFILPFSVVLGSLIGSIAIYIVGNHLLVKYGITGFAQEYTYGMDIQTIWQRSVLWAWAMPMVGFAIAMGIIPLLLRPKDTYRALKAFKRITESAAEFNIGWVIGLFLAATLSLSFVDYWLAPDFPVIYLILLNIIIPFVTMLVAVRGEGLGVSIGVPYTREMVIKATGYPGINAWFVPIYTSSSWVTGFKVCDMTNTRVKDVILGMFIIFPVALFVGYVTVQSLWRVAPIPSSIYPGVLYAWPVQATFQSIFISPEAAVFFQVPYMIYGFISGSILYIVGHVLKITPLIIGVAGGLGSPIPSALSVFIGAVIGLVMQRLLGREFWRSIRGIIYAGILLGEGLAVTIGTGLAVIIRSMWAAPY
ncbi:hypothetical protein KEJ17_01065 [Candidatus Bathyarchaeota archaeon]|nr:hypothetical protein [Candidatus Bathyarchaeota archaeon]